ncbi:MAG: YlmH/Sll1252 family protein [Prevotella sp.]|nr:YlmH/Sll1252 family protein [Alistipes senegalensis]MCM1357666.1 YlmH/Sll1252 family protein [Prevotella sp.]MCM1472804.1 YlmH/Sll1252 family protein [Muribaculaceae bacterium]
MTNNSDDKFFFARLADMVSQCERNTISIFSDFLDERQSAQAEEWCSRNAGGLLYKLWGGYERAGRKMLAIYPDFYADYIMEDFPFQCITFTYRKEDKLTHRDFLGTLMGMKFKRDTIGDIIVGEGITQVFVTEIAARLIVATVSKIGRTGVKCSNEKPFEMEVRQEFRTVSGTVASLRLDCIVSLATGLSREKSAVLIRSEKVEINHFITESISAEVNSGDIISVRGYGKFLLSEVGGNTRKNRIHIIIKKFV